MLKSLPLLFEKNEIPQFIEFDQEIRGASITFFYFVDFHSSTSFSLEKIRPFLKEESHPFPDKIDSMIWDDYYLKKMILFRGQLRPKQIEYASETGHILKGYFSYNLTIYNSMVACLQVILPLHSSVMESNQPLTIDVLIDLLNINSTTSPALFTIEGKKTTFFDSCQEICNQLSVALEANPQLVKHHEYDYNCVWLFDADSQCASGDEFAKKYSYACSGILATDKDWRKQNTSEVIENINSDIGVANHFITVSERVLLSVASRWDMGSSQERFSLYHSDPALLRAQEYAYYHRILLEKANSRIPKVEDLLGIIRQGEIDAQRLNRILELRLRMVRDLNERWNPYAFERGQETRIMELYFMMHGLNEEYQLANDRLNNIGEVLKEYYQLGQNSRLRDHEEQLIKIQKTNLISQLQMEEITHISQQNRTAVSLIGFVVLISFILEVVANGLKFIKETKQQDLLESIQKMPFLGENLLFSFTTLGLICIGITYLFYVFFGKLRQVKQQMKYKFVRSLIEKKAEFYSIDDDLKGFLERGETTEAANYLEKTKEQIKAYEQLLKQTKTLKKDHGIKI